MAEPTPNQSPSSDEKNLSAPSLHPQSEMGAKGAVSCEKIQSLLFDYLSNELGDKQSWIVREHLRVCPHCSHESAQLQKTVSLLKKHTPPNDLANHLPLSIRKRLRRAILHPIFEWVYAHRKFTAWTIAILLAAFVFWLACFFNMKPDSVIYWINVQ